MSEELSSYSQFYHNIIMRFSLRAEGGYIFSEEEALLYAEANRYLTAVAKALRLSQEEYNRQQENKKDNDENEDERPVKL